MTGGLRLLVVEDNEALAPIRDSAQSGRPALDRLALVLGGEPKLRDSLINLPHQFRVLLNRLGHQAALRSSVIVSAALR